MASQHYFLTKNNNSTQVPWVQIFNIWTLPVRGKPSSETVPVEQFEASINILLGPHYLFPLDE
jgi:hypothetical protein